MGVRSSDTNFGHLDSTPSEILLQISDMDALSPGLKSQILDRIDRGMPGAVWTPSDFLDLANRDAVDKTLQRLVKWGSLRRIDRGLYDKPRYNGLTQQNSPADPKAVIDAVARRDQIRVLVDGMTAANDLGFTNAVPAKTIVHSDARAKAITARQSNHHLQANCRQQAVLGRPPGHADRAGPPLVARYDDR